MLFIGFKYNLIGEKEERYSSMIVNKPTPANNYELSVLETEMVAVVKDAGCDAETLTVIYLNEITPSHTTKESALLEGIQQKLRNYLNTNNLTQTEFANKIGVAQARISEFLSREDIDGIKLSTFKKIMKGIEL
jgi:predicted XRE-type DNA-binding protein